MKKLSKVQLTSVLALSVAFFATYFVVFHHANDTKATFEHMFSTNVTDRQTNTGQSENFGPAMTISSNTQRSSNWAGYIDTPNSATNGYTSISGSWTVPTITGNQQGVAAK